MITRFFVINKLGKFKISDFGISLDKNIHITVGTDCCQPPKHQNFILNQMFIHSEFVSQL
jgi:hypothetical protein